MNVPLNALCSHFTLQFTSELQPWTFKTEAVTTWLSLESDSFLFHPWISPLSTLLFGVRDFCHARLLEHSAKWPLGYWWFIRHHASATYIVAECRHFFISIMSPIGPEARSGLWCGLRCGWRHITSSADWFWPSKISVFLQCGAVELDSGWLDIYLFFFVVVSYAFEFCWCLWCL